MVGDHLSTRIIPIYFDDPELGLDDIDRVSQMFVSDKTGKKSNKEDTGFITRTHESTKCLSPLPFIALLPDLNGEPELSATFPENDPIHFETDRCLRIYASGLNPDTIAFLRIFPKQAVVV